MKKKVLSLILALAMVISIAPLTFAADAKGLENFKKVNTYENGKFSDISSGDWYYGNVVSAYETGLVKGSSENSFNPKGNITVAETIALASRLHNIYNGGNGEFTQGNPWYQVYVDYATENKILREKYKDYNVKISRANFAFILVNALPSDAFDAINDVPDGTLPDVPDNYKAGAIYTLYRAGVLTGNDEFGTFKPDSTITRAEVAAIITRMADKSQRKALALKRKATVSEEVYRGALGYANMTFENNYGMALSDNLDENIGYGMTGADLLKQQTMSLITEFEAVRLFATENGIKLSDTDRKAIAAAKEQAYKAYGGKEAFISALKEDNVNEAFYDYLFESQMHYQKASELFGENGKFPVDTDAIAETLSGNYKRVKHILIQADATKENYKEKEALAKQILQKISRGEDFEKLIEEYGEDPGMEVSPDGYMMDNNGNTFGGGQLVAEFTEGSNALKVGEVSGIVKTAYGFHIIKRYPIDKTFTDAFIKANMETFSANALTNTLGAFAAKVGISNIEDLEKIDLHTVFGE